MNLTFNFGTLVRLERMTGVGFETTIASLSKGNLKSFAYLVAAALETSLEDAIKAIDDYLNEGNTLEDLSKLIEKSFEQSNLVKKQKKQKVVKVKKETP